jgi:hypothetical protein
MADSLNNNEGYVMFLLACLLILPTGAAESTELDLAQAIRTTREANRAMFTHWIIDFKYTVAEAKDVESATAGRWKNGAVGDGFSAFDGRRGRHEIMFSTKDLAEKRTWDAPDRYSTFIKASRDLTDGAVNMFDAISAEKDGKSLNHTSQINPGKEAFHDSVFLPLDLGRLPGHELDKLSHDILAVSEGKPNYTMTIREGVRLFNRDLIELTFTDRTRPPLTVTRRYWVDLDQGAMTRKWQELYEDSDGSSSSQNYIQDDIRQVGDSAWYPFRLVLHKDYTGMAYEWKITEAEFDTPPDQSVFRMEFDEPRPIRDNARDVRYPPQKVWDLDNLPAPEVRNHQPPPWTSAPAAPMPGERQSTPRWWTFAAIGIGVVLLTLAGRSFQRNRRDA